MNCCQKHLESFLEPGAPSEAATFLWCGYGSARCHLCPLQFLPATREAGRFKKKVCISCPLRRLSWKFLEHGRCWHPSLAAGARSSLASCPQLRVRRRHAECTPQAPGHLTSLPHPAEGLLAAFALFGNFRQELGIRSQGFSVQLSTRAGRAPAFCWACSRTRKQPRSLCMLPSSHTRCCLRHHRQHLLAQQEAINTPGPSFPGLQASLLQPTPALPAATLPLRAPSRGTFLVQLLGADQGCLHQR